MTDTANIVPSSSGWHYDHVSARLLRSPFLGDPQVQHVVQIDIR